jgi:hypothetical protein
MNVSFVNQVFNCMFQRVNWFVYSLHGSEKVHIVDVNVKITQSRSVKVRDVKGRNSTAIQMFFVSTVGTDKPCIFVSCLKCQVEGRTRREEEGGGGVKGN